MKGVAKLAPGVENVGLLDVPEPEASAGHVVIEVAAAGVCGTDIHIIHDEYSSRPPVIMGHEVAGTVADVGAGVDAVRTGDRVTSETYFSVCGRCLYCRTGSPNLCAQRLSIGSGVHGAFARYVLVPATNIHHLPDNVDEMAGALSEPLTCCVHALEQTKLEPGELAVVSGPGAIGLLMAQVAKAAGATVVVLGTSSDEPRLAMARQLGMDYALDVQADDYGSIVQDLSGGLGADVVFECSGAGASARTCLQLVRRKGRYVQVGIFSGPIEWDLAQVCLKELAVHGSFAHVPSAWRKTLALLSSGAVQTKPLISTVLPITEWEAAFSAFENRDGLKVVFRPE